jgi:hypothetical protein
MLNPQNIVVRASLHLGIRAAEARPTMDVIANISSRAVPLLAAVLLAAIAPVAAPAQPSAAPSSSQPPVAYASVNELNGILTQLKQTAQSMQTDLQKVRIEKWKTDAATKKQALSDSDSIQRNLQSTLPDTIAQLNNSPEDVALSFKLYRNLDALYDVFGSVAELAGAFGSKDEAQSLGNDLNELQSSRRAFGDRMQKLSASKEDELTRLRAQVKTLSAAPPPPPKKVIVDDTEPAPKPAKKKTPAKAKPPATAPATTPPTSQ